MNETIYTIEKLNKHHNKDSFDCSIQQLDCYIAHQAKQDMKRHVSVTYVLIEPPSNDIIGYHTLSATTIEVKNLPEMQIKKLPRYPQLPATLVGRLAVDKRYQSKGIGQLLLVHALKISLETSYKIASLAVVVEAKNDEAVRFYQHFGFIQFCDVPNKLYLPMETIRKINF